MDSTAKQWQHSHTGQPEPVITYDHISEITHYKRYQTGKLRLLPTTTHLFVEGTLITVMFVALLLLS